MLIRLSITIYLLSLLFCCHSNEKRIARNVPFYFTVSSPSNQTPDLVKFLKENLNNKRVAITNASGSEWPFYEVFPIEEEVLINNLMPPHDYVHLLKEKDGEIQMDEFYIDIKVMTLPDTIPNFALEIYRMDSLGLVLSAKTGIHFINETSTNDRKSIYDAFLKSIIRYSFK